MKNQAADSPFAKLPSRVKVGYRSLSIVVWEGWEAQRTPNFGEFDMATGEIRLHPAMDANKLVNTLVHELLHAVWAMWCLPIDGKDGLGDETEEGIVQSVANGWTTLLYDNPQLAQLVC